MNTIVSQIRIFKWKWKINGNKGSLISPVFLPKTLTAWGLNPGRPGANPTRYLETLPDYKPMVKIQLIFVTRNTTYAFNRSAIFLPDGLPVFINGYGVPFLSYYMLVLLIDLHKQLLFTIGKYLARPFWKFDP